MKHPFATSRRQFLANTGAAAVTLGAGSTALAARPRLALGGFATDRLARIPGLLQPYLDSGLEAGFVTLLYRRGHVAQVNAMGFQNLATRTPMRRDTIFRLASMTKPITCAAVLTLVDKGLIALDDPIDRWLPEFASPRVLNRSDAALSDTYPAPRAITLADLLTHRSGVAGQSATGAQAAAVAEAGRGNPTLLEWLERFARIPLSSDPGAVFQYGTSHDVLGALVERVTGQPFADYLQSALFDPLGMKDTGFFVPPEKVGRLATSYVRDAETQRISTQSSNFPAAPPRFPRGAGGMVSTADDYLRFASMLLNQGRHASVRILSRKMVELMTTDWLTPEQRARDFVPGYWNAQGFGLGVAVTDHVARLGSDLYTSPGSFGWGGRSGVWWRADPAEDMVMIFMIQNPDRENTLLRIDPAIASKRPAATRLPPAVTFVNQAYAAIEV